MSDIIPLDPSKRRVVKHVNLVFDMLLTELEELLTHKRANLSDTMWERVFSNKESVVMNLGRLIDALNRVPPLNMPKRKRRKRNQEGVLEDAPPLSPAEIDLIKAWLSEDEI